MFSFTCSHSQQCKHYTVVVQAAHRLYFEQAVNTYMNCELELDNVTNPPIAQA